MMTSSQSPKRVLSVFSIVMINVIAIDSLRNVPAAAEYGFSLVFYYCLAALCFFLPCAFVAAELTTGWPVNGGVYIWVREAFGKRLGFLAVWLQWIENVIWYPTIVAFVAATILYVIDPSLVENKTVLLSLMMVLFWLVTGLNLMGMKISSLTSTITALLGTIIPMIFIVSLGALWFYQQHPIQIEFSTAALFPDFAHINNITYLTGIVLSLVGLELSAVYALEARNPQRDYPRAMLYSVIIIISTLVLSSLAIAVVIPKHNIQLVDGLIQAFDMYLRAYHLQWIIKLMATLIVIGGVGSVAAWMLGPIKGLLIAAEDGNIPLFFQKCNAHGAPQNLLVTQAIFFSLLCTLFLLLPSVNSSYWVLTALATQLYMVMYFLMFIAAIKLRYKHPEVVRAYRVPGGTLGIWAVAGLGAITSVIVCGIGFWPPVGFDYGSVQRYEIILSLGLLCLAVPPLIVTHCTSKCEVSRKKVNI